MESSPRKVEKRNRPPVSCEPCRTRKLKCNRGSPCDSCIKRGKAVNCFYAANATRNKPAVNKQTDLRERLDRLEIHLSSILSNDSQGHQKGAFRNPETGVSFQYESHAVTLSDTTRRIVTQNEASLTPETPYKQEAEDGQVNYLDPSHWLSILDDIKDIKDQLTNSSQFQSKQPPPTDPDASLLFSPLTSAGLDDLLSALPPQPSCDMLLSWYFGSRFMVLGIIHPEKFQAEYEEFWQSPTEAHPLWVALLFSILSLTASIRQKATLGAAETTDPSPNVLRQATVQCLVLGRYATANAYALEALVLHLQSCFVGGEQSLGDSWFAMGTVIRLAFRMGYHRDPSQLTGMSAFEGEMRRRVWLNIFQVEALLSYQAGFPSMIPSQFCDTRVPRNLEYSDLQIDMTTLPPSRPFSDHTPVTYTVVKSSVMAVFKKIATHAQALIPVQHEETMSLDAEMRNTYSHIPRHYQRRDIDRAFMDAPGLILERTTIELLYLKGLIVLHRRYVSDEHRNPAFESSRRACVEAALDILVRQADIHRACEPGGRLHEDRWMFLSLQMHDFLLAAMVVCLDLSVNMRSHTMSLGELKRQQQLSEREYNALSLSQQSWNASSSPDARLASKVIDLMIRKASATEGGPWTTDLRNPNEPDNNTEDWKLPYAGTMSQMIDGSEIIDWGLLDQYFQHCYDGFEMDSALS